MTDLLWPGDQRAGSCCSDAAVLDAMLLVELTWLDVLAEFGVLPVEALAGLEFTADLDAVAETAEQSGNPVSGLVDALRAHCAATHPVAAHWLHRGLTSQDVLDTALMLCVREAGNRVQRSLRTQAKRLAELTRTHRGTVAVARTLGRPALPTTFGLTAASWLDGVLDAADDLDVALRQLPLQVGGAAGTLAGLAELLGGPRDVVEATERLARALGLVARPPWHTQRRPITRIGDALTACTDTWGRIADDVLLRSRPEFGELSEASVAGRGGSSTLPGKENPVLAVLIRRAALSAPGLAAQLHLAAANAVDERSDGAWHTEWAPLRALARRAVVAAEQTAELLDGLVVHAEWMHANAEAASEALLAERSAMRTLLGLAEEPAGVSDYLGATDALIDAALARAAQYIGEEHP